MNNLINQLKILKKLAVVAVKQSLEDKDESSDIDDGVDSDKIKIIYPKLLTSEKKQILTE